MTDNSKDEVVRVAVAWFGGFALGPVPAIAIWLSSERLTVSRAYGCAASLYWSSTLAVWVAAIIAFITQAIPTSGWLLAAALVYLFVSVVASLSSCWLAYRRVEASFA